MTDTQPGLCNEKEPDELAQRKSTDALAQRKPSDDNNQEGDFLHNGKEFDGLTQRKRRESEEDDTQCEEKSLLVSRQIILYKRRWLTLFIFSLNTTINGALFMSLSPINNIAVSHYDVNPVHIEWLSNMYMLAHIFVALPSAYFMSKWGVRPIIGIASGFDFIATLFHFAGYGRTKFWLILLGQLFAAIAYGMILQIPGKLSALWFPENEIATATSIGVFMNIFGIAMGFLQPTNMVINSPDLDYIEEEIKTLFLTQLVVSGVVFLLTVTLYRERPPTPPALRLIAETGNFGESLKLLWNDKYFIVFSQAYGIYFGLFVTFSVLVNPLITSKFPTGYETSLGWMGFWSDMAAIVSCLILGILLDKFYVHQLVAIFLNASSLIVWLAFILVLTATESFVCLFILFILLGVFGIPYFASGIDQASEMTYPVSEGTSSAVILILGNLYGFVFIFSLGAAIEVGHIEIAGYVMAGLYALSTVLALFAKTERKRTNAETQASSSQE